LGRTDQQEVFEKPEASILEQGSFQKTGLGVGQIKLTKPKWLLAGDLQKGWIPRE
jgi:hypothetical protein